MSENSAVFCEMGNSCPSHVAQPLGAKLLATMRISATNWSDMRGSSSLCDASVARRKNTLQRDDEIQHQIGRHVFVRLVSAGRTDALRGHGPTSRRRIRIGAR